MTPKLPPLAPQPPRGTKTTPTPTPPYPLLVEELASQGLVNGQKPTRRFGIHWVPLLKYAGGPIAAGIASIIVAQVQHSAGKAETEHKVAIAYETLAPATNAQAEEIKALRVHVAQLADTVQLQGRLLLASRPGFTSTGKPEVMPVTATHRPRRKVVPPADPKLVQKVQENAIKNLEEIKQGAKESPAPAPVPATLPSAPPVTVPGAWKFQRDRFQATRAAAETN